ncbi:hypothetical protein HYPSUDRAFT_200365 [Hypholoma sublateritium FD-334 SS-4]|uniref:F-box domain-containing protein n=1 Tax=Hypholoma sublateritium (strain FD-334 SS-4) TaxID=945553 RepID=A0A0D2P1M4_HYPSF|nr:hypothetical protein HYPSUDRAFT_200365 [Hypholoma sublateritium FD-334 SS-4]
MSALPSNSPIQCLDFDLLWCIVKMNANMFEDDKALEITLATSRVCRNWRSSMLGMPSIWAHLIDLDRLHCRTVAFRCEIIRRSGTALLWMKARGCINHHRHTMRYHRRIGTNSRTDRIRCVKYVLGMIDEHWSQIQRLEASMCFSEDVNPNQWGPLYLPAPHLESLNLVFPAERNIKHAVLALVGGRAPMRVLRYRGHISHLTAPWLHQLHTMILDTTLTVYETLGILTLTENLVVFELTQIVADLTTLPLPFVSLPNLTHLRMSLNTNLNPGAVLLYHIRIHPACSLIFSAYSIHPRDMVHKSTLRSIIRDIFPFIRSYFAHHAPRKISLTYSDSSFVLLDRTDKATSIFSMSAAEVFPPHALPILLSEFTLCTLSKVADFKFTFLGVDRPVPEFTTFTARLPSVEIISTDILSLHLTRAQEALKTADMGRIAFPALRTLKLGSRLPTLFDTVSDPISEFVMTRIAHGYAIDTIDFTSGFLSFLPNMVFINEADGLKVLWRQKGVAYVLEYICGVDEARGPENLLFV